MAAPVTPRFAGYIKRKSSTIFTRFDMMLIVIGPLVFWTALMEEPSIAVMLLNIIGAEMMA